MIYFTHLPSYAKIIPPPKCPMTVKAVVRECITFDFFFFSPILSQNFISHQHHGRESCLRLPGFPPFKTAETRIGYAVIEIEVNTQAGVPLGVWCRTEGSTGLPKAALLLRKFDLVPFSIHFPLRPPPPGAITNLWAVFVSRCLLSHPSRKAKRNNTGSIHSSTQPMSSFRFWIIPLWWLPSLWHHHVPGSIYEQKRCGKRIWPPNARSARNRKDPNSINFPRQRSTVSPRSILYCMHPFDDNHKGFWVFFFLSFLFYGHSLPFFVFHRTRTTCRKHQFNQPQTNIESQVR